MYTYYFLTAFKPELKQSFWWKKHITQVQLVSHYDISCDLDQNRPPVADPILHSDVPLWPAAAVQGLRIPQVRALLWTHTERLYVYSVLGLLQQGLSKEATSTTDIEKGDRLKSIFEGWSP